MKSIINIYIDGYQTDITLINKENTKIILNELYKYIQEKGYNFEINFTYATDPIGRRIPEEFMKKYNNIKIELYPYNFNKKLHIMFEYVSDDDELCHCRDVYCYSNCGTLICGCVYICNGTCGESYDSY